MLVVLPALAVSTLAVAGAQERTFEETVALESGGSLSLETSRGSVRVTSWDRPNVEIRARIEAPSEVDGDYALEIVEATRIDVHGGGRAVDIRTDFSDVPRRGLVDRRRTLPRVHYDIRAPRQLELELDVDRADTTVEGFEGRITLALDRSNVTAQHLSGTIRIALDRGRMRAGDIDGQVVLELDRSNRVMLAGVRGTLRLDADRTQVTMRGVELTGASALRIDRGNLDLGLVATQALTVDGEMSRRADFVSDLPVAMQQTGRSFRGTINGGGPELEIAADRSRVRLRSN
jgi:hypothetical protein